MKMHKVGEREIYSPNQGIISILSTEYYAQVAPSAIFIDLDKRELEDEKCLEIAISKAKAEPERKIILLSWLRLMDCWKDSDFRVALSFPNVEYARLPLGEELKEIYQRRKIENLAFKAAANLGYEIDKAATFKHDWKYETKRPEVLKKAREECNWQGTDEEIEQRILNYESKTKVQPSYFPGVFCDIEGTLLKNEKRNEGLIEELKERAKLTSVTIWTGGELENFYSLLQLGYPIVSKHWFKGSEVESIIDDEEKEDFERNYGITSREYKKI